MPFNFERNVKAYRVLATIAIILTIVSSSGKMIRSTLAKGDIEAYLNAANLSLTGGNIYTTLSSGGVPYLYPPLFAVLFIPLTLVPIEVAIVLWCLLNVFLIGWVIVAFCDAMTGIPFFALPSKTRWAIGFFSILLTSRFLLNHLAYGQANILIMALAVLGLRILSRGKLAGSVIIGVSIAIKVITFPFAIWFIKNIKVMFGIMVGAITGWLLPALILGFDRNWQFLKFWFKNIVFRSNLSDQIVFNVSSQAQLQRFFTDTVAFEYNGHQYYLTIFQASSQTLYIAWCLILLAAASAIVFYKLRYRKRAELVSQWGGVALTFSLLPLFPPTTQKHYFVMLLPSYIYIVYVWYCLRLKDKWFRGLVVGSFILTSLTVEGISGKLLGDVFTSIGCLIWGTLLLSAAIFRAAETLDNSRINAAQQVV